MHIHAIKIVKLKSVNDHNNQLVVMSLYFETRKPCCRKETARCRVLFGLKFADHIHYKFKSSQAQVSRLFLQGQDQDFCLKTKTIFLSWLHHRFVVAHKFDKCPPIFIICGVHTALQYKAVQLIHLTRFVTAVPCKIMITTFVMFADILFLKVTALFWQYLRQFVFEFHICLKFRTWQLLLTSNALAYLRSRTSLKN